MAAAGEADDPRFDEFENWLIKHDKKLK